MMLSIRYRFFINPLHPAVSLSDQIRAIHEFGHDHFRDWHEFGQVNFWLGMNFAQGLKTLSIYLGALNFDRLDSKKVCQNGKIRLSASSFIIFLFNVT